MSEAKRVLPTANVKHGKGRGKCPHISDIEILFDGKVIATATLGGTYSQKDALNAFKRERGRFKLLPGSEFALACGI